MYSGPANISNMYILLEQWKLNLLIEKKAEKIKRNKSPSSWLEYSEELTDADLD